MRARNTIPAALIVLVAVIASGAVEASGCTLAVVSGKAARDGRPLMWKNRDTDKIDNKVLYLRGPKHSFIALVDAGDAEGKEAWGGMNAEGFAVMNSQTEDQGAPGKDGADNGRFMRQALGECATVAEFEALLRSVMGKLDLTANFGAIDAGGSACVFETSPASFVIFDANDPRVAPFGYLVRTNYGFTSPDNLKGGGYIRFERVAHIFESGYGRGELDPAFILQKASRDLGHEKLHSYPLSRELPDDPAQPLFINTNDTLNRNSSVSVILFQGAPSRDRAYLGTIWVNLGQPVSCAAVPMWVAAGDVPSVATGPGTAPLNDWSKMLVSYLYPDRRGRMRQYLAVDRLRLAAAKASWRGSSGSRTRPSRARPTGSRNGRRSARRPPSSPSSRRSWRPGSSGRSKRRSPRSVSRTGPRADRKRGNIGLQPFLPLEEQEHHAADDGHDPQTRNTPSATRARACNRSSCRRPRR